MARLAAGCRHHGTRGRSLLGGSRCGRLSGGRGGARRRNRWQPAFELGSGRLTGRCRCGSRRCHAAFEVWRRSSRCRGSWRLPRLRRGWCHPAFEVRRRSSGSCRGRTAGYRLTRPIRSRCEWGDAAFKFWRRRRSPWLRGLSPHCGRDAAPPRLRHRRLRQSCCQRDDTRHRPRHALPTAETQNPPPPTATPIA